MRSKQSTKMEQKKIFFKTPKLPRKKFNLEKCQLFQARDFDYCEKKSK